MLHPATALASETRSPSPRRMLRGEPATTTAIRCDLLSINARCTVFSECIRRQQENMVGASACCAAHAGVVMSRCRSPMQLGQTMPSPGANAPAFDWSRCRGTSPEGACSAARSPGTEDGRASEPPAQHQIAPRLQNVPGAGSIWDSSAAPRAAGCVGKWISRQVVHSIIGPELSRTSGDRNKRLPALRRLTTGLSQNTAVTDRTSFRDVDVHSSDHSGSAALPGKGRGWRASGRGGP